MNMNPPPLDSQVPQQYVQIDEGLYYGKAIFGRFPYISERAGDSECRREMYVRVKHKDKEINVHVNRKDFRIVEDDPDLLMFTDTGELTEDELREHISQRFRVMAKTTEKAIRGIVRSAIYSGAPGIGKSYNLEKRLEKAFDRGEINSYTILKGKISAIALFAQLFNHSSPGDILVLDDIDVVFQDETALNLLKAALDTGDRRHLVWMTASTWLEENGIPQEFDFEGSCIFITNIDFDRQIERGSNLAPHLKALVSRSNYLNLGIHTNREILVHIKMTIENTTMLDVHNIDVDQKNLMIKWMEDNVNNIRELSLRTVLKIASYMKGDPEWKETADVLLLKYQPRHVTK